MSVVSLKNTLNISYRGALETCNYACGYCPFAKRKETAIQKKQDIDGLNGFVQWLGVQSTLSFSVFFTPWGEALVFKRYQQALAQLLGLDHVTKVVFQTNLSANLDFLKGMDCRRIRLWCTYHPSEVARERFIAKTQQLDDYGVKYSVGMVGAPILFDEIKDVRKALNPNTYLWINAYVEAGKHYDYSQTQQQFLTEIDPLFSINRPYLSQNLPCFAGETAIMVDEFGDIRRCHFINQVIGNIHQENWQQVLQERLCSRKYCDCHIGYIYLKKLQLEKVFGQQMVERIACFSNESDIIF